MAIDPKKIPTTSVILLNENAQVVLLKSENSNHWFLPMGEIESTETALDSAVNKTRESLGVDLVDIEPIGYSTAALANKTVLENNGPVHYYNFIFASTCWDGELNASSDVERYETYSMSELPPLTEPSRHSLSVFRKWLPSRVFQFS
jgi:ADP-ribose pyrophosphatase YjhB (NUDIX family)